MAGTNSPRRPSGSSSRRAVRSSAMSSSMCSSTLTYTTQSNVGAGRRSARSPEVIWTASRLTIDAARCSSPGKTLAAGSIAVTHRFGRRVESPELGSGRRRLLPHQSRSGRPGGLVGDHVGADRAHPGAQAPEVGPEVQEITERESRNLTEPGLEADRDLLDGEPQRLHHGRELAG